MLLDGQVRRHPSSLSSSYIPFADTVRYRDVSINCGAEDEIDLAADVCARAKLTCEFQTTSWDGIIPGLNAGKYDAIMSGMSITAARKARC